MLLPGSHYRRISESDIARYQNFLGQVPIVCEAGTIAVAHHGIWHCAQPNLTDNKRTMFKLRLNPTVKQCRLWNTTDMNNPEINKILGTNHGWYGKRISTRGGESYQVLALSHRRRLVRRILLADTHREYA